MTQRISGLNSGMDIDGMITKLMTAERAPQTQLKQKEQKLVWKQDAYRSINTLAASLRSMAFSMRFAGNWQKTTSTTSDPTKLAVSSDASAPVTSHSIVINSLATAVSNISSSAISNNPSAKLDPNVAMDSQASTLGITIADGSFTINGKNFNYKASDTLNSIIANVNASGAGVTMTYDAPTDKVVIATKGTGSSASIDFTGTNFSSSNVLSVLKLNPSTLSGQDASITLDGLATTRSSNTFTDNGVTYNLLSANPGQAITVNVGADTNSIKKSIQDLVDKYNTTISTISSKLSEPKFNGYQPLTDDQKSAMQTTDITNWNQKSQSGILQHDDALQKAYSDFRGIVPSTVTNVTGSFNSLAQIGISTGPYNLSDPSSAGKLIIDDTKLAAALAKDPQGVVDLFSNIGAPGSTDRGIAQQMSDVADSLVKTLIGRAGNVGAVYDNKTNDLGAQVGSLETQISGWDTKLSAKQNYYYTMFSKMDTAIGNSNAQISWLQGQFK